MATKQHQTCICIPALGLDTLLIYIVGPTAAAAVVCRAMRRFVSRRRTRRSDGSVSISFFKSIRYRPPPKKWGPKHAKFRAIFYHF